MKARLIRPSYFLWVVVPLTLWLAYLSFGLPHVLWRYEWRGVSSASFEERWKTQCWFIGPYGELSEPAHEGSCGWWIQFFKNEETS